MTDLNVHEKGQLYNFEAFVSIEDDDQAGVIEAYEAIIDLPHNQLPLGLVSSAFSNLASLYAQSERYVDALSIHDRWLELPFVTPVGQNYFFRAQLLYMLAQYNAALEETKRAIASTDEPLESWYAQLYVLQSTTGDQAGATETLEILNKTWPRERWESALEGTPLQTNLFAPGAEYLPIVKVAPVYPPRAARRGIEGYVIVKYTVTTTGETKDWVVVESTIPLFERAAIDSVKEYKYRPRTVDGIPIEVAGVQTKVHFVLED